MNADKIAKEFGWSRQRELSSNSHVFYYWTDTNGIFHRVVIGNKHGKNSDRVNADRARQRMKKCMNGKCEHVSFVEGRKKEILCLQQ